MREGEGAQRLGKQLSARGIAPVRDPYCELSNTVNSASVSVASRALRFFASIKRARTCERMIQRDDIAVSGVWELVRITNPGIYKSSSIARSRPRAINGELSISIRFGSCCSERNRNRRFREERRGETRARRFAAGASDEIFANCSCTRERSASASTSRVSAISRLYAIRVGLRSPGDPRGGQAASARRSRGVKTRGGAAGKKESPASEED